MDVLKLDSAKRCKSGGPVYLPMFAYMHPYENEGWSTLPMEAFMEEYQCYRLVITE